MRSQAGAHSVPVGYMGVDKDAGIHASRAVKRVRRNFALGLACRQASTILDDWGLLRA